MGQEYFVEQPEEAHDLAIQEAVKRANAHPNARGYLILDMDETLFLGRPRLHEVFARFLHFFNPDAEIPSDEDAIRGIRKAYEPLYNVAGEGKFEELQRRIVRQQTLYKNLPLTHESLPAILHALEKAGFITIMCLSGRSKKVMEMSRMELAKAGLIDVPVYALNPGDEHVPQMKTGIVLNLLSQLPPGIPAILVDDHEGTVNAVNGLNNPYARGILYYTPKNGKGETWVTIPAVLEVLTAAGEGLS